MLAGKTFAVLRLLTMVLTSVHINITNSPHYITFYFFSGFALVLAYFVHTSTLSSNSESSLWNFNV